MLRTIYRNLVLAVLLLIAFHAQAQSTAILNFSPRRGVHSCG